MLAHMKSTTVFARAKECEVTLDSVESANEQMKHVDLYGGKPRILRRIPMSNGDVVYEMTLDQNPDVERRFPEMIGKTYTIMASGDTLSDLLRGIMERILADSRAHVAENFLYDGQARFSQSTSVPMLTMFQRASRSPRRMNFPGGEEAKADFAGIASAINRAIDETRRPTVNPDLPLDKSTIAFSQAGD